MKQKLIVEAILKLAECVDAIENYNTHIYEVRSRKDLIKDILGIK